MGNSRVVLGLINNTGRVGVGLINNTGRAGVGLIHVTLLGCEFSVDQVKFLYNTCCK